MPEHPPKPEEMWVAMAFRRWSEVEVLGLPLRETGEDGSIGFLRVFPSKEAAQKAYPNRDVVAIREAFTDELPLFGASEME